LPLVHVATRSRNEQAQNNTRSPTSLHRAPLGSKDDASNDGAFWSNHDTLVPHMRPSGLSASPDVSRNTEHETHRHAGNSIEICVQSGDQPVVCFSTFCGCQQTRTSLLFGVSAPLSQSHLVNPPPWSANTRRRKPPNPQVLAWPGWINMQLQMIYRKTWGGCIPIYLFDWLGVAGRRDSNSHLPCMR
jgi:hypothetical protein